jgi:hypothetical protein
MEYAIGAEIGAFVANQAVNAYIRHRERIIDEGREEILLTSRIKKSVNNIMSRSTTPVKLEELYDEEKSETEEIENEVHSVAESIMATMPRFSTPTKKRNSLSGYNPRELFLRGANVVRRSLTPLKKEVVADFPSELTTFTQHLLLFLRDEMKYQSENSDAQYQSHKTYSDKLAKSLQLQRDGVKKPKVKAPS